MSRLWANETLLLPLSAAFGVQIAKFLWEWVRRRDFDFRVLTRSGGMPSSHSAMVTRVDGAVSISVRPEHRTTKKRAYPTARAK